MQALTVQINIEEIKLKLYEKLKPSGWADKLKTFIMSEDFDKLLNALLKEAQEGRRFTPVLKQVFRAFEECPYKELKVVIIGQDPYIFHQVADGIAFSCSNLGKIEPSLRYIYHAIDETVYPNQEYEHTADLARWSNQGVLMLNSTLTTTINKVGQHYEIWKPFMTFLFDLLGYNNSGLVWIFMGKKAEEWADSLPDTHHKLFVSHPASAAHMKQATWDCKDCFNQANQIIKQNNNQTITW
jgi:uracil-DNA glycosylase